MKGKQNKQDDRLVLTTRQGHPVSDNQPLRSVGERGPATLENYQFIEKITHFDRERIPELDFDPLDDTKRWPEARAAPGLHRPDLYQRQEGRTGTDAGGRAGQVRCLPEPGQIKKGLVAQPLLPCSSDSDGQETC